MRGQWTGEAKMAPVFWGCLHGLLLYLDEIRQYKVDDGRTYSHRIQREFRSKPCPMYPKVSKDFILYIIITYLRERVRENSKGRSVREKQTPSSAGTPMRTQSWDSEQKAVTKLTETPRCPIWRFLNATKSEKRGSRLLSVARASPVHRSATQYSCLSLEPPEGLTASECWPKAGQELQMVNTLKLYSHNFQVHRTVLLTPTSIIKAHIEFRRTHCWRITECGAELGFSQSFPGESSVCHRVPKCRVLGLQGVGLECEAVKQVSMWDSSAVRSLSGLAPKSPWTVGEPLYTLPGPRVFPSNLHSLWTC